jgi:hypothetical protein
LHRCLTNGFVNYQGIVKRVVPPQEPVVVSIYMKVVTDLGLGMVPRQLGELSEEKFVRWHVKHGWLWPNSTSRNIHHRDYSISYEHRSNIRRNACALEAQIRWQRKQLRQRIKERRRLTNASYDPPILDQRPICHVSV